MKVQKHHSNILLCSCLVILAMISIIHCESIYAQYYDQALKIAQGMNVDEKIGQTLQVDFEAITSRRDGTDPKKA